MTLDRLPKDAGAFARLKAAKVDLAGVGMDDDPLPGRGQDGQRIDRRGAEPDGRKLDRDR